MLCFFFFFFQAEDGIRDGHVTGVQTCALPISAALSHDTIAALYDYGEIDGRAYIVMELCPGRPLSEIIEENPGGLPEKRIVQILIDLARALDRSEERRVGKEGRAEGGTGRWERKTRTG